MALSTLPARYDSHELGSPSQLTQYHKKTGRPIRRSAGKVKAVAGFVDSKVIEEDDEPIEVPSEDEDGHFVKPQRKRKRTPSPTPPPLDPIIRDEELDEFSESESSVLHRRVPEETPIAFQVNVPLGYHGPLVVKLDRSLLVSNKEQDMRLPQVEGLVTPKSDTGEIAGQVHKTGFSDLPAEVRNKIYRNLFVSRSPLKFPLIHHSDDDLCRSGQFLSTCRLVYSEGCSILYSENQFVFSRDRHTRGPFWEKMPKEIGYTDVRRFLKMIGPENLAYLRDVRLYLEDASPSATPYLSHEERRYINDEHLMDCLRILRGAKLRKLGLGFNGRRTIYRSDAKFLSYLLQIKADEVTDRVYAAHWLSCLHQKISHGMWCDIQEAMTRKKKLYVEK